MPVISGLHNFCMLHIEENRTMANYNNLEIPALMELLIKHTREYTRMISNRVFSVEEFSQCKQTLAEIHTAIKEKSERNGKPFVNIMPNFPNRYSPDSFEGGSRA